MRRRHVIQIPPALPDKLPPPRPRKTSFLDDVHHLERVLYDGDGERSDEFRKLMNTVDTSDSQTGDFRSDMLFAGRMVKELATEVGGYTEVAEAKEKFIASKLQWGLKRHDRPEFPVSRYARLKRLSAPQPPTPPDVGMGE